MIDDKEPKTPQQAELPCGSRVKSLVRVLEEKSFTDKHEGMDGEIILSNGSIRIGIFPSGYPHADRCGYVLAEHEANFDKWSKRFYQSPIPRSDLELRIVLGDLSHIDSEDDTTAGNSYGSLIRSF